MFGWPHWSKQGSQNGWKTHVAQGVLKGLFPGWQRPGLIEARSLENLDPSPDEISGVATPRPH